jgi:transcriptional regulator with PAS, ATPase and Fis domain
MVKRFLASVLPEHESAELYRLMVEGVRESAVSLMAAALLGVCVAIDKLKHAQAEREQLYQQRKQERTCFANILDQMPSGVVLAEAPSGNLTYQNRAADMLLGRGLEAIDT